MTEHTIAQYGFEVRSTFLRTDVWHDPSLSLREVLRTTALARAILFWDNGCAEWTEQTQAVSQLLRHVITLGRH